MKILFPFLNFLLVGYSIASFTLAIKLNDLKGWKKY